MRTTPRSVARESNPSHLWTAALVGLIATISLLLLVAPAQADAPKRAGRAAGYLAANQQPDGSVPAFSPIGSTADVVVAWVAARRGADEVGDALGFLRRHVRNGDVDGVGLTAKVAMAAVAAGRDPRDFGGSNLIRSIRDSRRPNGRFGAGTAVFDQALAILALDADGQKVSPVALDWLSGAECGDGGWAYDSPPRPNDDEHCTDKSDPSSDFFPSDTNTTGLAVQALASSGSPVGTQPFHFFRAARDQQFGGWGYSPGFTTDTNSTALAVQAYDAMARPLPGGALDALRDLQLPVCGAWSFTWVSDGSGGFVPSGADVGATIGAIPAILRDPLPIQPGSGLRPATDPGPCV